MQLPPPLIIRALDPSSSTTLIKAALGGAGDALGSTEYVCVGDVINTGDEDSYLRGHGTQLVDGKLVATLCGVVERVDRLIFVRPLKTRYEAAQGDVVVGRVTEVAGKRWRVDLMSRQEAALALSAVHLPGGAQRRRNAEDELRMREVLKEADLVSAEVQAVQGDGSVALHTRSSKYGKLEGGQLVVVPPGLVKRQKQHFHTLEQIGVDIILGCNGLIWVAPHRDQLLAQDGDGDTEMADAQKLASLPPPTQKQMEAVVRVGNVVRALARCYLPIYAATILDACVVSEEKGGALSGILQPEFMAALVKSEALRRDAAAAGR